MPLDFLVLFGMIWWVQISKLQKTGVGSHGHVRKSENHENDGFSGFPKVKSKSYFSKMKQNSSTELSGSSFLKIYNKNAPPDPLDPKSGIFPDFPRFPIGILPSFGCRGLGQYTTLTPRSIPWNCIEHFYGERTGMSSVGGRPDNSQTLGKTVFSC